MSNAVTRPVWIVHQAASNAGTLHATEYSRGERVMRGLKSGLGFWLVAALCVFIPIAHFVLVPGFFVVGIVMGVRRLRGTVFENVTGRCPQCKADITLPTEADDKLPKWAYCPSCQASLKMTEQKE